MSRRIWDHFKGEYRHHAISEPNAPPLIYTLGPREKFHCVPDYAMSQREF